MENITIVNFPKNQVIANVLKKGDKEASIGHKKDVYSQLVNYSNNDAFKLEIKKMREENLESSYVMHNKDNKIFVSFDDKNEPYAKDFEKLYLEKKIKKEKKAKKVKIFRNNVIAAVITTAIIGGIGYGIVKSYDHELDSINEKNNEYINKIKQQRFENGIYEDELFGNSVDPVDEISPYEQQLIDNYQNQENEGKGFGM